MIEWEDFILKQENAKQLKIDDFKEPTKRDYIYIYCTTSLGGVCNKEEMEQITDIVYQAYLRKHKENKMSKELTTLEVSKQLEDFVLEFVKNGLDRRFIHGSFDIIKTALKALEIIKENLVVSYDENKNDKSCLTLGVKVDKDKLVIIYQTFDKEKIDLLKEVLL